MKLISLNCKNCNAVLTADSNIKQAYCNFCGSVFLIEHNITSNQSTLSVGDFEIKAGTLIRYNGNDTAPVIPYNVRHIGTKAFAGIDITAVTIPTSVTEIGQYAFMDCNRLEHVSIPASVAKINNRAFWRCFNLTNVTFEGDPKLGDEVFLGTPFWDTLSNAYRKQKELELVRYRVTHNLCPDCGGNYSLLGRCKICGRKKN